MSQSTHRRQITGLTELEQEFHEKINSGQFDNDESNRFFAVINKTIIMGRKVEEILSAGSDCEEKLQDVSFRVSWYLDLLRGKTQGVPDSIEGGISPPL